MRPVPSRERKALRMTLERQWGFTGELLALFQNEEGKVYVSSADLGQVSGLRIDTIGLHFGQVQKDGFSLSLEGAQLVGPEASKGVFAVGQETAHDWLCGKDIVCEASGWVIVKFGGDYLGSGRASHGILHNRVPKIRRLKVVATPSLA